MPPHDTINHLQQVMGHGGRQAFHTVPMIIAKVIRNELWRQRTDKHGEPFPSFEAFVTHPLWYGLESSIDDLVAYCRKDEEATRLVKGAADRAMDQTEAGAKGGRGNKASDNIKSFGGTSATYTLKRLKRDRPDLAAKVVAGELSANAAAIEAGFRKKPKDWKQIAERAVKDHAHLRTIIKAASDACLKAETSHLQIYAILAEADEEVA